MKMIGVSSIVSSLSVFLYLQKGFLLLTIRVTTSSAVSWLLVLLRWRWGALWLLSEYLNKLADRWRSLPRFLSWCQTAFPNLPTEWKDERSIFNCAMWRCLQDLSKNGWTEPEAGAIGVTRRLAEVGWCWFGRHAKSNGEPFVEGERAKAFSVTRLSIPTGTFTPDFGNTPSRRSGRCCLCGGAWWIHRYSWWGGHPHRYTRSSSIKQSWLLMVRLVIGIQEKSSSFLFLNAVVVSVGGIECGIVFTRHIMKTPHENNRKWGVYDYLLSFSPKQ